MSTPRAQGKSLQAYLFAALAILLAVQVALSFLIMNAGLEIAEKGAREGGLASAHAASRSVDLIYEFAQGVIVNGAKRPGVIQFMQDGDYEGTAKVCQANHKEIPVFEAVYVVDAAGVTRSGFPKPPAAPAYLTDLKPLLEAGRSTPVVASFVKSALSDEVVIVIGQRIASSDGRALGVLIGEISLQKLAVAADLLQLRYGDHGFARLLKLDGTILADPYGAAGTVGGLQTALHTGEDWAAYEEKGVSMAASLVPDPARGWAVAVLQPEAQAMERALHLRDLTFALFGGVILITVGLGLFFVRRVMRPLRAVTAVAADITAGDFKRRAPDGSFKELSELGIAFNNMTERLTTLNTELQDKLQEIERSRDQLMVKQRLEQELELAARIQTSILPKEPRVKDLEVAAKMITATEVGGDYYDVLNAEDGCWIGIGDVAGHGLSAGLVMLMLESAIMSMTRGDQTSSPSVLLRSLNATLVENIRRRLAIDDHVTMSLLRYYPDGRVVFSGAHEDIIVYRAATGRCECIATPGPWLGVMKEASRFITDHEFRLYEGDIMVLYTDGVTEGMSQSREQFGMDRFCAAIEAASSEPVETIVSTVIELVERWTAKQTDDITLVVMRYTGKAKAMEASA